MEERDLARESERDETGKGEEWRKNEEGEGDGEVAILYMTHSCNLFIYRCVYICRMYNLTIFKFKKP